MDVKQFSAYASLFMYTDEQVNVNSGNLTKSWKKCAACKFKSHWPSVHVYYNATADKLDIFCVMHFYYGFVTKYAKISRQAAKFLHNNLCRVLLETEKVFVEKFHCIFDGVVHF